MNKIVYQYDEKKIFKTKLLLDDSDLSPSGNWNIPADCTEIVPPAKKENYVAVWNGTEWVETEDYRKKEYWLPGDTYGTPGREVKEIGPLPEGATLMPPEQTVDELKEAKKASLKAERDQKEVLPIEYDGNSFDYDDKARERINAAIIALDVQGADASIDWTTATNADVKVTATDLRAIVAAVAVRSNALHIAYRKAKTQVEQATTIAEVEAITLGV